MKFFHLFPLFFHLLPRRRDEPPAPRAASQHLCGFDRVFYGLFLCKFFLNKVDLIKKEVLLKLTSDIMKKAPDLFEEIFMPWRAYVRAPRRYSLLHKA